MTKIVVLCGGEGCCPAIEISEDCVKIGEDDNTCTLTVKEWEILREKIKNNEL